MDATGWIALWALAFIVTHLGMTAAAVRPKLVAALGDGRYLGVYSLISFATFVPLVTEFFRHKHSGAQLWNLRDSQPARWLTLVMMLSALIFLVAAFVTPSPAGLAPNASMEPRGILKVTRHPLFISISLFGIAHLLMNGFVGDALFFATLPIVSIVGAMHQDQRKIRVLGERYRQFCAATSIVPFVAILTGRQSFGMRDLPWTALAIGTGLAAMLVIIHPHAFGGNPLG